MNEKEKQIDKILRELNYAQAELIMQQAEKIKTLEMQVNG